MPAARRCRAARSCSDMVNAQRPVSSVMAASSRPAASVNAASSVPASGRGGVRRVVSTGSASGSSVGRARSVVTPTSAGGAAGTGGQRSGRSPAATSDRVVSSAYSRAALTSWPRRRATDSTASTARSVLARWVAALPSAPAAASRACATSRCRSRSSRRLWYAGRSRSDAIVRSSSSSRSANVLTRARASSALARSASRRVASRRASASAPAAASAAARTREPAACSAPSA